jgi:hypothetical protein
MIGWLEDEIEDAVVVVPIENLYLDVPELTIANVTIVPKAEPPDDRVADFVALYASREEYRSDFEYVHSYAVVQVRAQWEKARDIAIQSVKDVLNILRLFIGRTDSGHLQSLREVRLIGETGLSSGRYFGVFYKYSDGSSGIGTSIPRARGVLPVPIGQQFIAYLKANGLPYLEAVLQDRSRDDFSRKIYRAITWLGRGICASTGSEQFTSYVIALESLLIHRETRKRATLAERVAVLLAGTPQEYDELLRKTKELYDLRSGIVHGGKKAERVAELEVLARRVILRFVSARFVSFESFVGWVETHSPAKGYVRQVRAIIGAIRVYAGAYNELELLQRTEQDWLPVGDQKTGVIGEFYAKIYLESIYPNASISFGNTSQHGWDLLVETDSKQFKVQVKTVSAYSDTRRISPIHAGWDELFLLYLDKSLSPTGFWIITDTSIVPPSGVLELRTMPKPDDPRSGSKEFAAKQDRLPALRRAMQQLS